MIFTVELNTILENPELTVTVILSALILIILAIIIAVVLFFTWRIRITVETVEEKIFLGVRIFGIKIPILPLKPKKYRISRYTLKKIRARERRKALREEKKAQKKAAEKKQKPKKKTETPKKPAKKKDKSEFEDLKKLYRAFVPHPSDTVDYLTGLIRFFFPTLLGHAHFHAARIRIRVGGPDAASIALRNTAIYTALIPALAFIERHSNLHGLKRADIDVSPDYLSEEIKYDVKLGFSISIGAVLLLIIRSMLRVIFGYLKIKPKSESIASLLTDKTNTPESAEKQSAAASNKNQTKNKK